MANFRRAMNAAKTRLICIWQHIVFPFAWWRYRKAQIGNKR